MTGWISMGLGAALVLVLHLTDARRRAVREREIAAAPPLQMPKPPAADPRMDGFLIDLNNELLFGLCLLRMEAEIQAIVHTLPRDPR
jgi:hypothetical protein